MYALPLSGTLTPEVAGVLFAANVFQQKIQNEGRMNEAVKMKLQGLNIIAGQLLKNSILSGLQKQTNVQ